MTTPGFVIAGTHSGVGKTSVTLGLLQALRERNLRAQPFKIGPDYIDTGLHTSVAGRASRNLDSWLFDRPTLREVYAHGCDGASIAVVEGVMGMYDGYDGKSETASTAHVAKLLQLPVLLVVDAWALSRSAAAVVLGFRNFDPDVRLQGVILNRVANQTHYCWLQQAIEAATRLPVLGYLTNRDEFRIEERHLGLIPSREKAVTERFKRSMRDQVRKQFNLAGILRIAKANKTSDLTAGSKNRPARKRSTRLFHQMPQSGVRIAVALDQAFHFYYQDNLELLSLRGAELLFFRPSEGESIPPEVHGIYLGGGYPEIFARQISANRKFLAQIRQAAQRKLPIYGECGGMMCLTDAIVDQNGRQHKMAGIIPARAIMQNAPAIIGYVHVRNRAENLLGPAEKRFRAHLFHNSRLEPRSKLRYSFDLRRGGRIHKDGIIRSSLLASYVHVHFASDPSLVSNFVNRCLQYKNRI